MTRQLARARVASGVTVPGGATTRVISVALYSATSAWTCPAVVGSPSERCSASVLPRAAAPSRAIASASAGCLVDSRASS